ncbi:hypothetical protein HDU81_011199 [Chytriomyces hyalinus]|nr:hypothetical protein HDU81_011199 [Chytriomyces hyalinus]
MASIKSAATTTYATTTNGCSLTITRFPSYNMYQHFTSPITTNAPSYPACVQYMSEHSAEIHGFYYNTQTTVCGAKVFDSLPGNDLYMYTQAGYVDMGPVGGDALSLPTYSLGSVFTAASAECVDTCAANTFCAIAVSTNNQTCRLSTIKTVKPEESISFFTSNSCSGLGVLHRHRPHNSHLPIPQQKYPAESTGFLAPTDSPATTLSTTNPTPDPQLDTKSTTRRIITILLAVVAVFVVTMCVAVYSLTRTRRNSVVRDKESVGRRRDDNLALVAAKRPVSNTVSGTVTVERKGTNVFRQWSTPV